MNDKELAENFDIKRIGQDFLDDPSTKLILVFPTSQKCIPLLPHS